MYELWFKIEVWQLAPKHNECYFGGIKYILDASPTYHNATGLCIGKHLIPIRASQSVFVSDVQFCVCEWFAILCLWVMWDSVLVSVVRFCFCEWCRILCLWVLWDSVFVSDVGFCVCERCAILCVNPNLKLVFYHPAGYLQVYHFHFSSWQVQFVMQFEMAINTPTSTVVVPSNYVLSDCQTSRCNVLK